LPATKTNSARRLGTIQEAADEFDVGVGTIRSWIIKRRIYAERIGTGRYRVDLDDIAALSVRRVYPPIDDPNDAAKAPPLTTTQIHQLRSLLNSAPATATP
jgi:excisionase family DNA binding protein